MKIDYDLAKDMMIFLEKVLDRKGWYDINMIIKAAPKIPPDILEYHYYYLYDCGFIHTSPRFNDYFDDLTPLGHRFVETASNKGKWEQIKGYILKHPETTLNLFKEVLEKVLAANQ